MVGALGGHIAGYGSTNWRWVYAGAQKVQVPGEAMCGAGVLADGAGLQVGLQVPEEMDNYGTTL